MRQSEDLSILRALRRTIIEMVYRANEGHIPSAFSVLEIIYILYKDCLEFDPKNSKSDERDYFVLSKGHAGPALYVVLGHFGFFKKTELTPYCQPGSLFGGHPDACKVPGVEVSSGSLGHGIAMAVGIAIGLRLRGSPRKVVVLVGDGEMDEGPFWESLMMIKNLKLTNVVVIADCNGSQKYSYPFEYGKMIENFGWRSLRVDGHDLADLSEILQIAIKHSSDLPTFVHAKTLKGFGVKRFEGEHAWHRRTPNETEFNEIMAELR